jgi:hypothetical protein
MAEPPFTTADFHNVAHKQLINAVAEALADTKLGWEQVAPFLEAARRVCRDDFREGAQIRFHAVRADGEELVEAEEAFLGIAVADRDDGVEWLSETFWVSDIALAERDTDQVRRIAAALERSLARINAWLAEQREGGPDSPSEPPADSAKGDSQR